MITMSHINTYIRSRRFGRV